MPVSFVIENHEQYKSGYVPDGIEPRAELRVPEIGELVLTETGEIRKVEVLEIWSFPSAQVIVTPQNTFKNTLAKSGWKCPIWGACSIVRYVGDRKFYVRYKFNGCFFEVPIREEDGPNIPAEIIGRCELRDGYPA